MIQLVCKGDLGHTELEILRYFTQPALVSHPNNHVIPLLDEIHHLDMDFAVLPLLSAETLTWPAFRTHEEELDAMAQTFEVNNYRYAK